MSTSRLHAYMPWPVLGAAAVWLVYPVATLAGGILRALPGHWPAHFVAFSLYGLAAGALAAASWMGVAALRHLDVRARRVAAGSYGVLALLCLVLVPAAASDAPPQGRPEAIIDGAFLLLPLILAFAATAAGLAVSLVGPWRWVVVAAAAGAGPVAFLLASRGTDLAFFHNTLDVLILVLMPGLLPAGLAVAVLTGERVRAGALLALAGFLAPWLAWGTMILLWDGLSWTSGLPLGALGALVAAAAWPRGRWVLVATVLLASFPIWMLQCMWGCDFPT